MKYTLVEPNTFGEKHFPIPLENIIMVHHGTFGCFNNFNNVLIVKYIKHDSYDGEESEALEILGHFEYGKNIYGHLGFDFFLGKDPDHIQIYNFNSKYIKEDVMIILNCFCK